MDGSDDAERLFSTGDLARMTGNTLRTVRYYEEMGLLTPVPRDAGSHRQFTALDLDRLKTVTDLRAVGLTLEQAAEVLHVTLRGNNKCLNAEKAGQLIDEQLTVLRERLATLARVEKQLADARALLDQCRACPKAVTPECVSCDTFKDAQRNPLVNVLLSQQEVTIR